MQLEVEGWKKSPINESTPDCADCFLCFFNQQFVSLRRKLVESIQPL